MNNYISPKILVPTDFSINSKAGIRFAIQLASLWEAELVFAHVFHVSRPLPQTDEQFLFYRKGKMEEYNARLEKFVAGMYRSMKMKPGKYSCLLLEGFGVDSVLIDHCRQHPDIGLICISTRGAGRFDKVLGTHTGNLITRSIKPVLAVPASYRLKPIRDILYASDFFHYKEESEIVIEFARLLKASVRVLHFCFPDETLPDVKAYADTLKKTYEYGLKLSIRQCGAPTSLVRDLQKQIRSVRPSIVILFTNQERSFFQRFFQSSRSEKLAFETKVPLLVFNKRTFSASHSEPGS